MLWHTEDGLFYDREPTSGRWIRVNTPACFWPMLARQASEEQADRLAKHLADPEEYLTEMPIPSVALNDPHFSLDCLRGPTWLSQGYLAMRGLHTYGRDELAHEIGWRALDGAAKVFDEHETIFEYYHPHGGPTGDLLRKGSPRGPLRDFLGHNPIHAIGELLINMQGD
jgi:neutral trehalase